jgi:glycosyltransferase involved in cell wall biosynthesis
MTVRPRVLHLISSSGFLGAESVVLELAKQGSAAGYWVTVGVINNQNRPNLELADAASSNGLDVKVFSCNGRFDIGVISEIRNFIRKEKPNLLHSHGYKGNFYSLAASRRRIPWVVTNHLWKRTSLYLKLYALLDSFLIRTADRVVAVSDDIAIELLQRGVSRQKIVVIDNGVDLIKFSIDKDNGPLKRSLGLDENSKVIGTVASLTTEKGHSYLLKAAVSILFSFPNTKFLFVGDGPERNSLERQATDLGLQRQVRLVGSRKNIPEILSIVDIFVLPSLKEGLPMALLEAMAARLPVVATAVGAVPKVVIPGRTGLLVKPADPEELRAAIEFLLRDRTLAVGLAEQGQQKVQAEFSSGAMGQKYFTLYCQVLQGKLALQN